MSSNLKQIQKHSVNHIVLHFYAKIKFFIGTEANNDADINNNDDDDKDGWSFSTKEPYQLK